MLSKSELFEKYKLAQNNTWNKSTVDRMEWAMDEYAEKLAIEFAEWLFENTETIKEEKITLYRYYDSDGWGNYILEDIYQVFKSKQP